ncbi:MAG TPA: PAS domain-containing protein, partial [Tissierellaceae bacterium]|nr:PAS domain-containing protein [Tissierellaceae bacterium]
DKHYSRKENLIFPYLEKYKITAPPKVMWGVHDEIRAKIKGVILDLEKYTGKKEELIQKAKDSIHQVEEMIFKEENILFPMSLETLVEDEWITIYNESGEIGYTFVEPKTEWADKRIERIEEIKKEEIGFEDGLINFDYGSLSGEEINAIFEVLPGELSFVDKDDRVKFFTKGEDRIFARTKSVIGRPVELCHPHSSVHKVNQILEDFKSGKKDSEDFWIHFRDMYVLIRFFAVRNKDGEYLGTLEYVQNIKPMQELTGEKRLLSE